MPEKIFYPLQNKEFALYSWVERPGVRLLPAQHSLPLAAAAAAAV